MAAVGRAGCAVLLVVEEDQQRGSACGAQLKVQRLERSAVVLDKIY